MEDVEKLLEEKYGVVSVRALRKRFNVKELREDINISEQDAQMLREAEKKRLRASDNT
jgi:DNA-binding Xre family transcriptional regulator